MSGAAHYIHELEARGRYQFTTAEAVATLGDSLPAVQAALRRLKARGAIATPHKGFHVIVPPEYQQLGCLPAEHFVPQLMAHLGEHYYVGLLSAAELHGAAHQRPQALQVMVQTARRPLRCGRVRVQFIARKDLAGTPVVETKTPRGLLRIASKEATALELVGYAEHCGGLDNVASVLSELAEHLESQLLVSEAARCPVVWLQRLGYLLELTEREELASALELEVQRRAQALAPLVRAMSYVGAPRSERWKLVINTQVEPDL